MSTLTRKNRTSLRSTAAAASKALGEQPEIEEIMDAQHVEDRKLDLELKAYDQAARLNNREAVQRKLNEGYNFSRVDAQHLKCVLLQSLKGTDKEGLICDENLLIPHTNKDRDRKISRIIGYKNKISIKYEHKIEDINDEFEALILKQRIGSQLVKMAQGECVIWVSTVKTKTLKKKSAVFSHRVPQFSSSPTLKEIVKNLRSGFSYLEIVDFGAKTANDDLLELIALHRSGLKGLAKDLASTADNRSS